MSTSDKSYEYRIKKDGKSDERMQLALELHT